MKVWVTRAEPGASRTAQRLLVLGHQPVVTPLLVVRPLPAVIDLTDIGALAFTSANGVRAFATLTPDRGLPAYTVGDATAQAAREAGFGSVTSAGANVAALAAAIQDAEGNLAGIVLSAGACDPAGDLIGDLTSRGIKARALAVYDTVPTGAPMPRDVDAVLIHSPRAAALVAAAPIQGLTACCISPAAAAPLKDAGLLRLLIASGPNEAALLDLLS